MKKQILLNLFLFTFLCASPVFAQRLETAIIIQRPNYSGTWKLNFEKSSGLQKSDDEVFKLTHLMVIEQNLPAIGITFKRQQGTGANENFFGGKVTLWMDGRGDEYVEGIYAEPSTSEWKDNKLTVTHYTSGARSVKQISSIEEYNLSGDGKTLTNIWKQTDVKFDEKKGTFKEERYFDDKKTIILVFDKIR